MYCPIVPLTQQVGFSSCRALGSALRDKARLSWLLEILKFTVR